MASRADGGLSGQVGVRPDGTLPDTFREEVRQALDNVATGGAFA